MTDAAKHPLGRQAVVIAVIMFLVIAGVVALWWIGIRMGNGGV